MGYILDLFPFPSSLRSHFPPGTLQCPWIARALTDHGTLLPWQRLVPLILQPPPSLAHIIQSPTRPFLEATTQTQRGCGMRFREPLEGGVLFYYLHQPPLSKSNTAPNSTQTPALTGGLCWDYPGGGSARLRSRGRTRRSSARRCQRSQVSKISRIYNFEMVMSLQFRDF